jgi:hypothetical protein
VTVSRQRRELVADWLIIWGAAALFMSLFLAWSHQFSAGFLAEWAGTGALRGAPRNPTAWQAYSIADVLLALLAAVLPAVALIGGRRARIGALAAAGIALAFTLHALSVPPTNGANIFPSAVSARGYVLNSPSAGLGETVAIAGLGVAVAGLLLSVDVE